MVHWMNLPSVLLDKARLATPCNMSSRVSLPIKDPLHVRPIAHAIWDPHFGKTGCGCLRAKRAIERAI